MIYLDVQTGFSFLKSYGSPKQVIERVRALGADTFGIADFSSTWGHLPFYKEAKENGLKMLFGVQLAVVPELVKDARFDLVTIIAKTQDGLKAQYDLVSLATEQFYYRPRVTWEQLGALEGNIFIVSKLSDMNKQYIKLLDKPYLAAIPERGYLLSLVLTGAYPVVAAISPKYPGAEHSEAYQLVNAIGSGRKTRDIMRSDQYMMKDGELVARFGRLGIDKDQANEWICNASEISDQCDVQPKEGRNVRPKVDTTVEAWCINGAIKRGIDLTAEPYKSRYEREIGLIYEKGFDDYFLLIADLIEWARARMFVGPARGSSAGSLVCYLMEIVQVDPIEFDLLFERFIDINRMDLPDIDIDFPDDKRELVFDYIIDKYGAEHVARIGTISVFKPKSALNDVGKCYSIPSWEIKGLTEIMLERSGGDARANMAIEDTISQFEVGQDLVKKFPKILMASRIEGHPRHTGKHAAGIIVADAPVTNYFSVNRRNGDYTGMIDKNYAESIGLLKIDALGLKTLAVIDDCCAQVGIDPYSLCSLDREKEQAFKIFQSDKVAGIFQMEGYAVRSLMRQMGVSNFNDIVALTALARPGPLHSGSANEYILRRTGEKDWDYDIPELQSHSSHTYGTIVYQEQVMSIARDIGDMSWQDVSALRKAMSKSLGEEFFNVFRDKFVKGATKKKISEEKALHVWSEMCTHGCLSGDTMIKLPSSNQYSPNEITLKQLYENGGYAKVAAAGRSGQLKTPKARIWSVTDNLVHGQKSIQPVAINDIWESGVKETYLVELEDRSIRATLDHKFLTATGWVRLGDLQRGDVIAVKGAKHKWKKWKGTGSGAHNEWHGQSKEFLRRVEELRRTTTVCAKCKSYPYEETHHIDHDRLNNSRENLLPVCRSCHKSFHDKPVRFSRGHQVGWQEITFIGNSRKEMTYDISMEPANNYVADGIVTHNSWSFNKSHAVSYALISYWCAYLKSEYPLEFAVAHLRRTDSHDHVMRLLRELIKEGIKMIPFDPEKSELNWSIKDGKIYGGFTAVKGIGPKTAEQYLEKRTLAAAEGRLESWTTNLTPAKRSKILAPNCTPWHNLNRLGKKYKELYSDPENYTSGAIPFGINGTVNKVEDIDEKRGEYCFIGTIKQRNLRDLNETQSLAKRNGRRVTHHELFLNLTVEDDTGSILCTIDRWKYPDIGKPLMEANADGMDFLIRGENRNEGWRKISIEKIIALESEDETS